MWGAYWAHSRGGTLPLPASVPYQLSDPEHRKRWADAARRWRRDSGGVPKVWKAYWGKFSEGPEGQSRPFDMRGQELPDEFWAEYLETHPDGHWQCGGGEGPAAPWQSGPREEDRVGYYLIKGRLCYKHKNGVTYDATGVDSFPPE
jgi:hypothetical protein